MKPKIDESLYKQLRERVQSGAPVDDLLEKYKAYDIRNLLEEASAMEMGKRDPRDLFEKPEVFKDIKIRERSKLPDYGEFEALLDPNTKAPIKGSGIITLQNKADKGTLLHELNHAYDTFKDPNTAAYFAKDVDDNTVRKALELGVKQDLKGIEAATEKYASHFKPEDKLPKLKQMLNFERLIKGQPLKMLAPVAIGAAAMGATEKAMAGDLNGASKEAGQLGLDLVTPDLLQAESVNTNEADLLDEQRKRNETPEVKRFKKIQSILEGK